MRWVLFCLPLLGFAQDDVPADSPLLAKIRVKVAENLVRLPNYTCAQTTDRSTRGPNARRFRALDTVRLEVAMVDGKELYGWPGSNRISESELGRLVGGTIGNGDFGLLASSIFLGSATVFTYIGEVALNGAKAIRYDYAVPLDASGYRLKAGQNEAVVSYHGSFLVDPGTLDLRRLELVADEIPEILGLQSCKKVLDYSRTVIGGSEFLLPAAAQLTMLDPAGGEHRNRSSFHDCRQYAGESVLSFDDPPPGAAIPGKIEIRAIDLPDDFGVELSLITPIDSGTAAVGDQVQARLERDLKHGGTLIAPKGAILSGRILKLYRQNHSFHLVISPHSLDFEDRHGSLTSRENVVSMLMPAQGPALPAASGYLPQGRERSSDETIAIEGGRLNLPRGFPLFLRSRLLKSDKQ